MFTNSVGKEVLTEEPIFPLLSFNPQSKVWKCVGTGFFIQALGGFVTAKHVFFDNEGNHLPTLFAVQTTSSEERHIRTLKHIIPHPNADIAIGFLGSRRLPKGMNVDPEIAVPFTLDFEPLKIGDKIRTYAFPLTESESLGTGEFLFTFKGKWSTGEIIELHEEGSPLVKNRCYQTTMTIEHGASGGPVLKNNLVVGINSSGMKVLDGDISFITPIDFILELTVPVDNGLMSIKELIRNGSIPSK